MREKGSDEGKGHIALTIQGCILVGTAFLSCPEKERPGFYIGILVRLWKFMERF